MTYNDFDSYFNEKRIKEEFNALKDLYGDNQFDYGALDYSLHSGESLRVRKENFLLQMNEETLNAVLASIKYEIIRINLSQDKQVRESTFAKNLKRAREQIELVLKHN